MKNFKTLYDFHKYCEDVNEDSNDFFMIALCTSTISEQELLDDVSECLTIYYKYLKEAVDGEFYKMAHDINLAVKAEVAHYTRLGKALYKKSMKKQINAIGEEIKQKYLFNV